MGWAERIRGVAGENVPTHVVRFEKGRDTLDPEIVPVTVRGFGTRSRPVAGPGVAMNAVVRTVPWNCWPCRSNSMYSTPFPYGYK